MAAATNLVGSIGQSVWPDARRHGGRNRAPASRPVLRSDAAALARVHGVDSDAIDAAAQDPLAIGKIMVDQVWAEGTDPTGGWVRVLLVEFLDVPSG
ncbi:MAG: hypothetical protein ACK6BG_01400 [Cyanobacteriota bacterium]